MRLVFVVMAAFTIACAVLACGSRRLPAPSFTSHPTSALVEVPYPPPPARVEYVPPRPSGDVVWIDGEWTWRGRRWSWRAGRWVVPPPNASFAPWMAVRDQLGTMHVAQGAWRDRQGNEVPPPKTLAFGRPNSGPVVNPEGEDESVGPTQMRDGRTRLTGDAAMEDAADDTDGSAADASIAEAGAAEAGAADATDLDATTRDSARMPLP